MMSVVNPWREELSRAREKHKRVLARLRALLRAASVHRGRSIPSRGDPKDR